jgi:hypothetical protein
MPSRRMGRTIKKSAENKCSQERWSGRGGRERGVRDNTPDARERWQEKGARMGMEA